MAIPDESTASTPGGHRRNQSIVWMRPEGTAGTLIGVESRSGIAVDPASYDETIAKEVIVDIARRALAARFPVFEGALMRGSWSGVVRQSSDDHPIDRPDSRYRRAVCFYWRQRFVVQDRTDSRSRPCRMGHDRRTSTDGHVTISRQPVCRGETMGGYKCLYL